MCGIVGFTGRSDAAAARATARRMVAALAHRGPDGSGVWTTAGERMLALGHARLAIIDLSPDALQPFHRAPGAAGGAGAPRTIVFNGEIYNYLELRAELAAAGYAFRTSSDTEVLLAAWDAWGAGLPAAAARHVRLRHLGPAARHAVSRPRPVRQEAAALFPRRRRPGLRLRARGARRPPGLRPGARPGGARPVPALQVRARRRDALAGVRELPPGHLARWQAGRLEISRHFTAARGGPGPPAARGPRDRRAFRAELAEAVRLRLRSDVPLGAFLSGGLDSSAIVALMAEQSDRPVRTFSIGFREQAFSELWAARLVASASNRPPRARDTPLDFLDSFEAVTRHRGAPLSEMADIPVYLLSKLAARHVKVVLSGEGSDELLAGYPKHWGTWRSLSTSGWRPPPSTPPCSAAPPRSPATAAGGCR